MTPLRKAMIKAMQIRGFSQRTHQSYLAAVADLARYTRCSPDRLSPAQVNGYFEYLVTERELAPASCRLIVAKPNSIIEVSIMSARR
jgi:integrase/recombinase XerD